MNYIDFGCAMCVYPIYIYMCVYIFLTSQVPCHPLLVWPCSHERSNWSTFQSSINPFKEIWGGWLICFFHTSSSSNEFQTSSTANKKQCPTEFKFKLVRFWPMPANTHPDFAIGSRMTFSMDIFRIAIWPRHDGVRPLKLKSSELFTMRGLLSLCWVYLLGLYWIFHEY